MTWEIFSDQVQVWGKENKVNHRCRPVLGWKPAAGICIGFEENKTKKTTELMTHRALYYRYFMLFSVKTKNVSVSVDFPPKADEVSSRRRTGIGEKEKKTYNVGTAYPWI